MKVVSVQVFSDVAHYADGVVVIESDYDLAEIQMTRHGGTGAVAAEHFMALTSVRDGEQFRPSGA